MYVFCISHEYFLYTTLWKLKICFKVNRYGYGMLQMRSFKHEMEGGLIKFKGIEK